MSQVKEPFDEFCSSGDELITLCDSLSHPLRIKILGILHQNRQYVSELARMVNISRPLLYLHLRKLEQAKLIKGNHEISVDGKAMKYYEIQNFDININPDMLSELSKSVTIKNSEA